MMDFSRSKFDIIGKAKIWYSISIIIIALGIFGMIKNIIIAEPGEHFPLVRGIDFAGGSIIEYEFRNWDESIDEAALAHDVQLIVEKYTDKTPKVQTLPLPPDPDNSNDPRSTPALLLHIRADSSLIGNQEAQENLYNEIIELTGSKIIEYQFDSWDGSRDKAAFSKGVKAIIARHAENELLMEATQVPPDPDNPNPSLLLSFRVDNSFIDDRQAQGTIYSELNELGLEFTTETISGATVEKAEEVSAVIGKELTANAIKGVLIGLVLILIYITIRLSLDFAVFAVVALFHDVIILCGIFALFGIEINSPFVAVLLTVVGYSINDTIVIYDRIRENMKVKRHLPFDRMVNQSLLETLARSINTSFTTLLAITALLVFGGITLRTFMFGLGVGVLTGTYSSIFVASLLLVSWRLRGKNLTPVEEPDAVSLIQEDDEELIGISEEEDEEEIEAIEPIKPITTPTKPKKKKTKRRKRRH